MANYEQEKLKSYLAKANLAPAVYDTSTISGNPKKKFLCRVSVKTFDYIGMGTAIYKEQAESLAAHDFLVHLEYKGLINQSNLTSDSSDVRLEHSVPTLSSSTHDESTAVLYTHNTREPPLPPTQIHFVDLTLNSQRQPVWFDTIAEESNIIAKRKEGICVEKEEEERKDTFERTGWTLENCKSDLIKFAEKNKIKLNYRYNQVNSSSGWSCIISFLVNKVGREFRALGRGRSKKLAAKACAFDLVGQLFNHGLIEPSANILLEKRRKDKTAILPAQKGRGAESMPFDKEKLQAKKRIGWCPPTPIWDAWLARETTGLLCKMNLEQISIGLRIYNSVLDTPMKVRIRYEQSILPVWNYRLEILNAISKNQVVYISGSIGSGKTTQVPQFILDDYISQGCGAMCNIIMTQCRPRSAVNIAERIAYERCEPFRENSSVGFDIGHWRMIPRPFGAILISSIELLLKRMEEGFRGISHIIIDDLHEPNSNKEFLLSVLRNMIETYPKLKVILMASAFGATVQKYFPNCPMIVINS